MRQIGTLPRDFDPKVLGDHLLSLGIKTRFDDQPGGWLAWVYDENHLERARSEFESFLANPNDDRFTESQRAAETVRKEEQRRERDYRKNFREVTDLWSTPNLRRRPVTALLVLVSVGVFLLQQWPGLGGQVQDWLGFFSRRYGPQEFRPYKGLTDIALGQVWRLITPIFLHFTVLGIPIAHILFNMVWLVTLGTVIEVRRRSWRFVVMVLVSAVLSNLAEYIYMSRYQNEYVLFGGMSGVVFALFGYVWVKGETEPEQGMRLNPSSVSSMIIWLLLCMTGVMGSVANAAHVVGLLTGMTFAMSRF